MNDQEAKLQRARTEKYQALNAQWLNTNATIKQLEDCGGDNPFTGSTRESRRIVSLRIDFSKTRGGASPTTACLYELNVEAWEFALALTEMLRAKRAALEKAMKGI